MNDKLITSDQPLSPDQQSILAAIIDTIVPASDDGAMPSATELNFIGYLQQFSPESLTDMPEILAAFDDGFANQELMARYDSVKVYSEAQPTLFLQLLAQVYACYYQDARVQEAIGIGTGAPFPRGNTVEPGDLSLLDPVMQSDITWRR